MPKKKKPFKGRGSWNGVNPVTRMTPTFKEKKERLEKKHRKRGEE